MSAIEATEAALTMSKTLSHETDPLLGTARDRRRDAESGSGPDEYTCAAARFDPNGDPDDPLQWSPAFKWSIVALLALMAFSTTFACISIVPIAARIVRDLDGDASSPSGRSASVLLVTIWELGEAAGPLLIAPLSEMFGRRPVVNVATALMLAATVLAASCRSTGLFIAARCLTGMAVTANVLNPAIVGDMFESEQRGSAMSLLLLAPLLGGAVGPTISGAVVQLLGWRQVVWASAGFLGMCELLVFFFLRETYRLQILKKRAKDRSTRKRPEDELDSDGNGNGDVGGGSYTGVALGMAQDVDKPNIRALLESVTRPATVFFESGVLMALSVFGSIVFAYFYILSVTLNDIMERLYSLSPAAAGVGFMFFTLGSFLAVLVCNTTLDRLYIRLRDSHSGVGQPEFRLPLAILAAIMIPFAVSAYGWCAQLLPPLPVFLAVVFFMGFAIFLAFLPLLAYMVDGFGDYSASALTGLIVIRCLMGTFLPLSAAPLVDTLGWGWGFSVLGAVSLALAPIPVLVMRFGPSWRMRSRFTREA